MFSDLDLRRVRRKGAVEKSCPSNLLLSSFNLLFPFSFDGGGWGGRSCRIPFNLSNISLNMVLVMEYDPFNS